MTKQKRKPGSVEPHPGGRHTFDDVDYDDPRVIETIRRVFEFLATIPVDEDKSTPPPSTTTLPPTAQ